MDSIDRVALIGFQGINAVKDPDASEQSTFARVANTVNDVSRDLSGQEDREVRKALNASYDRLLESPRGANEALVPFPPRRLEEHLLPAGARARGGERPASISRLPTESSATHCWPG